MIAVWGLTDRGRIRRDNQDFCAYALNPGSASWGVVCDGMGGANAGDIASRLAVETFQEHMLRFDSPELDQGARLLGAVEAANQAVFEKAQSGLEFVGMGTTMVAVAVLGCTVWVVNVGDSRAYYVTKSSIRRITRDHSVVEDMVENGDITPEQARRHPQRNLITRALGTGRHVKADLFRQEVTQGDSVLLCSDGLVNEVTDEEIHGDVLLGGTPQLICRRLLDHTLAHGASDNVTVVLFQL